MLDPMEKSSELRAKCFLTASNRRGDCVDNKKVGWYEMERIVADHQLAARNLPLTELYQESIPWARLDVLHEEAYYLADARGHIKESLTYLLTLFGKEPIRALLPNRRITVCFPAYVSDTDVQRIAKKISGDDKDFIASFLLTSDAWKAALQRDFPKAYQPENFPAELVAQRDAVESELNERAKELEKLMEPPPEEQDDEGKAALAKQINSLVKRKESLENQIRHAINEKLTRELQEKIEPARQSD